MHAHACAGKAKYDSKKHALVWKIKKFTGATEQSLVSAVELIATTREKKAWSRPPISMTFQVGYGPPVFRCFVDSPLNKKDGVLLVSLEAG